MDTIKLKNFVGLAQCLNFTEAAKCLYMSQPTLSRQIAELEKDLGVRLFARTKRTVELTAEGEEFLKFAKVIVENSEEILKRSKRLKEGITCRLNFGYPKAFDIVSVEQYLKLKDLCVNCSKSIDICLSGQSTGTILSDLEVGKLDVAIIPDFEVKSYSDLESLNLGEIRLKLLVPKEHELAGRQQVVFSDFKDLRFIMLMEEVWPLECASFYKLSEKNGVNIDVIQYAEDVDTLLLYVALGKGASILATNEENCMQDKIKCVDITSEKASLKLSLVWRNGNQNCAVSEFIEGAKGVFS